MEYDAVFAYVRRFLEERGGEQPPGRFYSFRKRSEHIRRVYLWARRLAEDFGTEIDGDALCLAALFHDIGYAGLKEGGLHAPASALLFEEWAESQGMEDERRSFISFLIAHHSEKDRLPLPETPLELVLLMEADLLDETGALSIVWDCMMEGAKEKQSFLESYRHICRYSGRILDNNPMVTPKARQLWEEKQELTRRFLSQLSYDLGET